jgi:two-component system heavy metal sensor histidine kinase CusS
MKRSLSLIWRLTGLYIAVSAIVLGVLSIVITLSIEKHFLEQDKETLESTLDLVSHVTSKAMNSNEAQLIPYYLDMSLHGHIDLGVLIQPTDSAPLYSTPHMAFNLADSDTRDLTNTPRNIQWNSGEDTYRGLIQRLTYPQNPDTSYLVLVGMNINHHQIYLVKFKKTLAFYILIAALVSGLLGYLAAKRGLMPLYTMKNKAMTVTANQLNQRMPVESVPEEMSDLAIALNQMLERLEDAFRRLSELSSDMAHELRTPVSNLMTQTQVALSKPRDAATYQDILASNAEEYERLSRMISDMLFLAKADNDLILPSHEAIELEVEVKKLFEFYDALAEDKQVTLSQQGQGRIYGDPLMVRRAINNLLSNAIRYTPSLGNIRVDIFQASHLTKRQPAIWLNVTNNGVEIPTSDLPHLFERFYRSDRNRSKESNEGTGLGLAITKAIVTAHHGEISVVSKEGKTTFSLVFPAEAS